MHLGYLNRTTIITTHFPHTLSCALFPGSFSVFIY